MSLSLRGALLRVSQAALTLTTACEGMDGWIDMYHAVRRLTPQGTV